MHAPATYAVVPIHRQLHALFQSQVGIREGSRMVHAATCSCGAGGMHPGIRGLYIFWIYDKEIEM
jgi:hypothetical protein